MRDFGKKRQQEKFKSRNEPAHLFELGQAVQLSGRIYGRNLVSNSFIITGKLPSDGHSLQYRIRNSDERHERVISQDGISKMVVPFLK